MTSATQTKSALVNSLVVDRTHLGRRASGLERITEELFSDKALAPLPVSELRSPAPGKAAVAAAQMIAVPWAMVTRPRTVWAFPGFPPSPLASVFRERCIMYVHDLFLITRKQDLNRAAKIYMAYPFRVALKRLRYFLVNSLTTGQALAPYVRDDAVVQTYRPRVRNIFDLQPVERRNQGGPLVLGAVGTVEPRKNFLAGAAIALELGRTIGREVRLDVIGRPGWGGDYDALGRLPHVKLHGFLSEKEARDVIGTFDLLICTSHDEGLGLPLLEAQYAGLQIVAPEAPVFREVLGSSGLFINSGDAREAAATLSTLMRDPEWRMRAGAASLGNVARWNALAELDRETVIHLLGRLLETASQGG